MSSLSMGARPQRPDKSRGGGITIAELDLKRAELGRPGGLQRLEEAGRREEGLSAFGIIRIHPTQFRIEIRGLPLGTIYS